MFTLPKLPYDFDELQPVLSTEQVEIHYTKHHQGYVDKLNELVLGGRYTDNDLEYLVQTSAGVQFNMAAQIYNHNMYWLSMSPHKSIPSIELGYAINKAFGTTGIFKDLWVQKGKVHFGSGWIWLIKEPLSIVTTHDADTPIKQGKVPLLACDLWEHAYYIDYKSERERYLKGWINKLVNWKFASKRFEEL